MTEEQMLMFDFSPNALWAILGCEVERAAVSKLKPWRIVRTVTDKIGRVVSRHTSGDAGYDYERSVALWLLFGTAQESIIESFSEDLTCQI